MNQAMQPRVFVDGNNVMGSRADGWWRDRGGAARRIAAEIALLARSRGGVWTIVFDGPGPRDTAPSRECLTVVHAGHGGRDSADDRIVELVGALPDRTTALVYTSDAGLRSRVHAMGAQVAGAQALLKGIAAVRGTTEPSTNGGAIAPRVGIQP
jgi:predicted RNA-binding protein with PIN domain